ncbi:hypothetical protein MRB53_027239 [Persea americana]|uniref:Uncharacterized protein n=1 Tax=Persea americana TaxID=3435 RepID=A0ACC2LL22_PERAE|nr:hypothetical protein MRB53_027239 [Persea americana]
MLRRRYVSGLSFFREKAVKDAGCEFLLCSDFGIGFNARYLQHISGLYNSISIPELSTLVVDLKTRESNCCEQLI